jgi:hypothetical protein
MAEVINITARVLKPLIYAVVLPNTNNTATSTAAAAAAFAADEQRNSRCNRFKSSCRA